LAGISYGHRRLNHSLAKSYVTTILMFPIWETSISSIKMRKNTRPNTGQLTLFAEEAPANHSPLPGSEKDWMIRVATWPSSTLELLSDLCPGGLSGKMSPASFQATEDGTLAPSSGRWLKSGIHSRGESWMRNFLECPNAAVESSLSDILETGDVPQRYFLSPKACAGILRRARARKKSLPLLLEEALQNVVTGSDQEVTEDHS